jgi:hypothetical protein
VLDSSIKSQQLRFHRHPTLCFRHLRLIALYTSPRGTQDLPPRRIHFEKQPANSGQVLPSHATSRHSDILARQFIHPRRTM